MTLNEYQNLADLFKRFPDQEIVPPLIYASNALCGEAGELAGEVKKVFRDHNGNYGERYRDIVLELGDVLWYAAALANAIGTTLDTIATANLMKLKERHGKKEPTW